MTVFELLAINRRMHVLLALRGGNTQIKRFIGNSISYSPSLWENTAPGLCSPSPTAFGVRGKKRCLDAN